jgi:pimeloyl-ACP methyl ester carboxylesterase
VDTVPCRDDAAQTYALYVPSTFTPARRWPVLFVFDAMGHGRTGVERYQAAAEQYGYLVAGSNNSRNGPWDISLSAAEAMIGDVATRFPLDARRVYTAGMSGGARVAMRLALDGAAGPARLDVAGVLASSAGFPDGFQTAVSFPIFGTAGTDDFNHEEMRELDEGVRTPHRVEVFEGGHAWLPASLATDGIQWMEIQAMQSGRRPRDPKEIDEIFAARVARAEARQTSLEKMRELRLIADDFQGLRTDTAAFADRAAELARQPGVQDALQAERADEQQERQTTADVFDLRDGMAIGDNVAKLRARLVQLLGQSNAAEDSSARRIARRVLAVFRISSSGMRTPELQELLNQIRPPAPSGAPQ